MFGVFWLVISSLLASQPAHLELGPNTILIYENESGDQKSPFVIRMARFHPDIVFEWETVSYQGIVHLFKKAVSDAEKMTADRLFQVGIDLESKDTMTKWLSLKVFQQLMKEGKARLRLNGIRTDFLLAGRETFTLSLDEQEVQVPAIRVRDSRKGEWLFHDRADNPLLLGYYTEYYKEELKQISTDSQNHLRWLRAVPPVR
jgi:hypothetical protein